MNLDSNNDIRIRVAANIVRHQPKPIPINTTEALQMADALLLEFNIKDKMEDLHWQE